MKNLTRATLAVMFVTLLGAGISNASSRATYDGPCGHGTGHACPKETPEINPEMGAGALALIGGMAMVIRSRRKA
jgi:hypothetical protein